MRQLPLSETEFYKAKPFGGELLKKARNRTARPLSTQKAMHLVLRSSQATGDWSFRQPANRKIVDETLNKASKKYGIKVYRYVNSGNHLHLIVKLTNRFTYRSFIRALTGTLAIKITKSNKFRRLTQRFWDRRPFTRLLEWGRDYNRAVDYLLLNQLEAAGIFDYSPGRLKDVCLYPFGRPRYG